MRGIETRIAGAAALAMMLFACASARSNGWVELSTDSTGPTVQIAGAVHRLDVEGGVWVIRDAQGTTYQPANLPEAFRKEGTLVEAVARRSNNLVSIGMAGTLVELLRIRERTGERAVLTGTVAYRERIALPSGAVVQVQLADVSKQDAASTTVAETTIEPRGKQGAHSIRAAV